MIADLDDRASKTPFSINASNLFEQLSLLLFSSYIFDRGLAPSLASGKVSVHLGMLFFDLASY